MSNESMKKVFQTRLTDTSTLDLEGIGVLRFEGSRVYKWVTYNTGTGVIAAVAGNGVVYHGDDAVVVDSAADVTSDYSDGSGIVAGVLQAVIANASYGWIQIKGIAVMNLVLDSGADGNELIVGTTDGSLAVRASAAQMTAGVAIDASAKEVLLDCPW